MITQAQVRAAKQVLINFNKKQRKLDPDSPDLIDENLTLDNATFDLDCEQLSGCCGVLEISTLDNLDNSEVGRAKFLIACANYRHAGIIIATTIPSQRNAVAVLKATGFEPLSAFAGNTHNRITLWQLRLRR